MRGRGLGLAGAALLAAGCCALAPRVTFAGGSGGDDKSGVKPQVITLPSGPGSIEGIGEAFEPDLSTGTARYTVKLEVAPGVAGFQPDLDLEYDGGNPNGPWGLGWKLSIPYIQRATDEGLPTYDDATDHFIYSNGGKLALLSDGVTYRFRNEGAFMRFRRLPGGGWQAHTPDGRRYVFGESDGARVTNGRGVFRWQLERQVDTHGNAIEYRYIRDGGYLYPREVRYSFSADGRYSTILFVYEPRTDAFTDRGSRAPVSVALRCAQAQIWALDRFTRAYQFGYLAERSTGRHSLLQSVTQLGDDGASALPSLTFTYTAFDPAAYNVVSMQNPPPVSLQNADADLVDINADSLPDIVYTPADGHRYYLNRGSGRWALDSFYPEDSPGDRLSSPNTRMADMDGNGRADLLVKSGSTPGAPFYYYAGQPERAWESGDRVDYNLSPGFSLNDPDTRLFDANGDRQVDIMRTTTSEYYVWLAHPDHTWSESADVAIPALAIGTPLQFSDPRVKLGDMTGDRLQDLVFVRDGLVAYFPHSGYGDYAEPIYMGNPPVGIGDLAQNILLGDLNHDGLDDLVLVENATARYWLNRGDDSFAPETVLNDTPHYSRLDTAVRLADVDGDGTMELLYSRYPAPPDEIYQYVDLNGGAQPLLLSAIDNGLGLTTTILYRPAAAFYTDDWDSGIPWTTTLPFPVQVVHRAEVHDANSGDTYATDYAYHDGYYDGALKEFRGFGRVEKTEHGDATADTTVTRYTYDTGSGEESRKGLLLETAITGEEGQCNPSPAGCYRREVNALATRILNESGPGRRVAYSYIARTDIDIFEQLTTPVRLRQVFARDDYGNLTSEFNYGRICGSDLACGNDERLKYTSYARDPSNWVLNKPAVVTQTDLAGNLLTEMRMHYDGPAYTGLPVGEVQRGDLARQEELLLSPHTTLGTGARLEIARFINTKRQAFDVYGNVTGALDANGNLTTVDFDALAHTYPIAERRHLEGGRSLLMVAAYHPGFGKITAATDFGGHPYVYTYDTFGRITRIVLPGDTLAYPTHQFTYTLGIPRSSITTASRERSGAADVRLSVTYYDGLGRKLQTRGPAEYGQFVVADAITFNARQSVRDKIQPYFDDTLAYQSPDLAQPHTTLYYDAMKRSVRTVNPDGTHASIRHEPLARIQYDEEDNTPGSVHAGTPKTLFYDGLDRLTGIQELNHSAGPLQAYTTTYGYDPLGNLTRVVDAQGNVKTMQYDALSRKVAMEDPDRHAMTYRYDDAGNLVETRDARGQVVRYTYDAAKRPLAEQWVLSDTAIFTAVVRHYDHDLSALHTDARNTLGQLSYLEDQAGQMFYSYDERGNIVAQIRRFADSNLEFVTRMRYDDMGRLVELTYPDGMTVTHTYNAQGLLDRIPGFVEDVSYTASGRRAAVAYANHVTTTFDYDDRLRLWRIGSTNGQSVLQDMAYTFDNANNIVALDDRRPGRTTANDQTQAFRYDDLYRLASSSGTYGRIEHTYDRIGNMVWQTSTLSDLRLNLGNMRYGEYGAGPHALTFAGDEQRNYDANGNLAHKVGVTYAWDFRDRLVSVASDALTSTHIYDSEGRRATKTVLSDRSNTTTYYASPHAVKRGERLVKTVFAGETRIAEVDTVFSAARLISGFQESLDGLPPRSTSASAISCWYLTDHLGGTAFLVCEPGQSISEFVYYPYGLTRYTSGVNQASYRYTGKELDETSLYDYGARFYDPLSGRFISVDPLLSENPDLHQEEPAALSNYTYANNNPVSLRDDDGLETQPPDIVNTNAATAATPEARSNDTTAQGADTTSGFKQAVAVGQQSIHASVEAQRNQLEYSARFMALSVERAAQAQATQITWSFQQLGNSLDVTTDRMSYSSLNPLWSPIDNPYLGMAAVYGLELIHSGESILHSPYIAIPGVTSAVIHLTESLCEAVQFSSENHTSLQAPGVIPFTHEALERFAH